jgi:hypothetical protein
MRQMLYAAWYFIQFADFLITPRGGFAALLLKKERWSKSDLYYLMMTHFKSKNYAV